MYDIVTRIFSLLNSKQRFRLARLQILVIAMAFFEVATVALIGPFIAVISDPSVVQSDGYIGQMYSYLDMTSFRQFVFFYGGFLFVFMFISSVMSVYGVWKLSWFATSLGAEISSKLFESYMNSDWMFHVNTSSAQLTKRLVNESQRLTSSVLQPLMLMNARLVLILFILVGIVLVNPLVAFFGVVIFGLSYLFLFYFVRGILYRNGQAWSDVLALRYKIINTSLGGIREILVLGRSKGFVDAFNISGKELARAIGANGVLTQAPRYLIEFIAFGSLIALILTITKSDSSKFIEILPMLAVYAFAALKLLPAFQQLYVGASQIKGNTAAFESIEDDLLKALSFDKENDECKDKLKFHSELRLNNVFFIYPGASQPALKSISLQIDANTTVGIVGPSGSGKTTILALLSGLITPSSGEFWVDSSIVDFDNVVKWKNIIGYVPQDVFISESSLEENIAFGIPKSNIDQDALKKAIELANLEEFISQLSEGLNTEMGERGVNISGGQRQRIGIARALYNDPQVLIFDEATSALDGNTERLVMNAIKELEGMKTIILVAHRLQTVESCKKIFIVENGEVIDNGSYEYLLDKNSIFKKLAGLFS
jgi:ATP-binding cassette, subfamily B, bacterial PglK